MTYFVRLLHADFIKTKRLSVKWLHVAVPLTGIILFVCYYSHLGKNPVIEAAMYMQTLAIAFPLLIGIICSLCIEQESNSGKFKDLLTDSTLKVLTFYSKYAFCLILGLGALLFASIGFYAGFSKVLGRKPFDLNFYVEGSCILFLCSLFEYIFHLFLSIRLGKSVSISIGIVESFAAYLIVSGFGGKSWIIIPCSWGVKFMNMLSAHFSKVVFTAKAISELNEGIVMCIVLTAAAIIASSLWFSRFEGRKAID